MSAQLMTAAEVIDLVLPVKNLDAALLEDNIELAQIKYLKESLGQELYVQLINQTNAGSYTGLNETLLNDYIKPALARYVVYESLPLIKAEITSNGVQMPTTEYGLPADEASFAMLRNKMKSDAGLLLRELDLYLLDNASNFPHASCNRNNSFDNNLPYLY